MNYEEAKIPMKCSWKIHEKFMKYQWNTDELSLKYELIIYDTPELTTVKYEWNGDEVIGLMNYSKYQWKGNGRTQRKRLLKNTWGKIKQGFF